MVVQHGRDKEDANTMKKVGDHATMKVGNHAASHPAR
jgi:hypothetical protein